MTKKKEDNTKLVSALSYILVGIIWYFVDKSVQNKKTKFHVKQALNLIIFEIGWSFIASFFYFIPVLGIIAGLISLFFFVLFIIGIINAINEKEKELPIIGQFADRYLNF